MIKKLKQWLRNWLLDGAETKPIPVKHDRYLECVLVEKGRGVRKLLFIQGSMGLMLRGVPVGETGERVVSISQAVDPDKFGALWLEMTGKASLSWEDEPYDKKA